MRGPGAKGASGRTPALGGCGSTAVGGGRCKQTEAERSSLLKAPHPFLQGRCGAALPKAVGECGGRGKEGDGEVLGLVPVPELVLFLVLPPPPTVAMSPSGPTSGASRGLEGFGGAPAEGHTPWGHTVGENHGRAWGRPWGGCWGSVSEGGRGQAPVGPTPQSLTAGRGTAHGTGRKGGGHRCVTSGGTCPAQPRHRQGPPGQGERPPGTPGMAALDPGPGRSRGSPAPPSALIGPWGFPTAEPGTGRGWRWHEPGGSGGTATPSRGGDPQGGRGTRAGGQAGAWRQRPCTGDTQARPPCPSSGDRPGTVAGQEQVARPERLAAVPSPRRAQGSGAEPKRQL